MIELKREFVLFFNAENAENAKNAENAEKSVLGVNPKNLLGI
jgi:hypothetical protein